MVLQAITQGRVGVVVPARQEAAARGPAHRRAAEILALADGWPSSASRMDSGRRNVDIGRRRRRFGWRWSWLRWLARLSRLRLQRRCFRRWRIGLRGFLHGMALL